MTKTTLIIAADADPSFVRLALQPDNPRVLQMLYLSFSAAGGDAVGRDAGDLLLPDVLFRLRLPVLRQLQRQLDLSISFDEATRSMANTFVEERRLLASAAQDPWGALAEDEVRALLVQQGFQRTLTPEQLRDVARLGYLRHGANFSVPGAGKTTALLALHAILRSHRPDIGMLIVAPRNALMAWDEEIDACFGDSEKVVRLTGGAVAIQRMLGNEPRIAAITYQQLPIVADAVKGHLRRHQTHIVLDESHRVKRSSGVQALACLDIAPLSQRRDILTGTPMPQHVADLYSQFDFLWPGHNVCAELKQMSEEQDRLTAANGVLRPLFMRTTKAELGLPELRQIPVPVELGPRQRDLYEVLRSETARVARLWDRNDARQLRSLGRHVMRLLQAASNPALLLTSSEAPDVHDGDREALDFLVRSFLQDETPAKVGLVDGLVRSILDPDETAKVVIWSSFVRNIAWLEARYAQRGAVAIHGAVPTGDDEDLAFREARIRRFNEDASCRVLVANPAACGEGISLHHACHNAIYFDRTYNAAHFLQSIDRIHRLGLTQDTITNAYVLVASETVDESVQDRVAQKIAALGLLLDDEHLTALALDDDEETEEVPAGLDPDDLDSFLAHVLGPSRVED